MRTRQALRFYFSSLLLVVSLHGASAAKKAGGPPTPNTGEIPLVFESGLASRSADVRFLARSPRYTFFLTEAGAQFVPTPRTETAPLSGLKISFADSQTPSAVEGAEEQTARFSYFIGDDPAKWRSDQPTFGKVRYEGVYEGVDVVFYGKQAGLEFDFVVQPGASPEPIGLELKGAEGVRLAENGDLIAELRTGDVRLKSPISYQEIGGERVSVESRFRLESDGRVDIEVGAYDEQVELTIDPYIEFSSYFGDSGTDRVNDVAAGSNGIYLTGMTLSNPFYSRSNPGVSDCYVMRLSNDGTRLLNVALVGSDQGGGFGWCFSVTVDSTYNQLVHVAGHIGAPGFPLVYPAQTSNGGTDMIYFRMNASLSRLAMSTYWGGSSNDSARGVDVDDKGNAYVVGETSSGDFPTVSPALQPSDPNPGSNPSARDGFLVCFGHQPWSDPVLFSTYLGGKGGPTAINGVGVDPSGSVLVAGWTESGSYPTRNAYQPLHAGGRDMVISQITSNGSGFIYSTFLGGPDDDEALDLVAYSTGVPVVVGSTESYTRFPWVNAMQTPYDASKWSVVLKFDWRQGPLFSTSWGKGEARSVTLDKSGDICFGGQKGDHTPLINPVWSNGDGYLAKIHSSGRSASFSTAWPFKIEGVSEHIGSVQGVGTVATESSFMPIVLPFDPWAAGDSADAFIFSVR